MSDSEDDITELVQQFMAVTGAEDTVAMCFLQQSSWNVEVFNVFRYKALYKVHNYLC